MKQYTYIIIFAMLVWNYLLVHVYIWFNLGDSYPFHEPVLSYQDWIAQTLIKFKSQLNLKCKLIPCTF
jgi:hypothetical protein